MTEQTATTERATMITEYETILTSVEGRVATITLNRPKALNAISNQLTAVTLDLSGLEYIDSAGIRVLFTLANRLTILQIALRLVVPDRSPVRKVIDLSGMAAAVPVHSS